MISRANGNRLDKFAVSIGLDIEASSDESALLLALEALERVSEVKGTQSRITDAVLLWLEPVPEGASDWVSAVDLPEDDGDIN